MTRSHKNLLMNSFAGVTNVELTHRQLDVNQCPGERRRNVYANSAVCDSNAIVSDIAKGSGE